MNYQLLFVALAVFGLSSGVAVPQQGLYSTTCEQLGVKFFKFGQCISSTQTYQHLNLTFWYQASMNVLCGWEFDGPLNSTDSPAVASLKNILQADSKSSHLPTGNSLGVNGSSLGLHHKQVANLQDAFLAQKAEELYLQSKLPEAPLEKRIISGLLVDRNMCLSLCETLQKQTDYVDECWKISGFTFAYGICTVGCHYLIN